MQAIIFDLDGTLTNTMPFHARAWQLAFQKRHGVRVESLEAYLHEGEKAEEFGKYLYKKYLNRDGKPEELAEITEFYKRELAAIFVLRFFPGALELVSLLVKKGYRLGLVSGSKSVHTLFGEHIGHLEAFAAVVSGDDTSIGKPAPDPYLRASELLQIAPSECLAIENAPFGIRSAVAAGMQCWAVLNDSPVPGEELLAAGATKLLEQIADLAGQLPARDGASV